MLKIKFFPCNPFQELSYLVWDEDSLHCLIIDPGMCNAAEWNRMNDFIVATGLKPQMVLVTHSHTDHVMGAGYIKKTYPEVEIWGSKEDQNHLPSLPLQNQYFGVDLEVKYAPIDNDLYEGDCLSLKGKDNTEHKIKVIDCPGHSHHGLCYYFEDDSVLFSGDVLFYGSVGRSDWGSELGGNGRLLAEGILTKLFVLPKEVKVYPGHGLHTTIGHEMDYNPFV